MRKEKKGGRVVGVISLDTHPQTSLVKRRLLRQLSIHITSGVDGRFVTYSNCLDFQQNFFQATKREKKVAFDWFLIAGLLKCGLTLGLLGFAYTLNNTIEFTIEISIQFGSTCFEPQACYKCL